MELLLKKYRVVRPNLPNFGGSVTDKWGVSVHEIERRIESCIQDARRDGEKITLIAHDWGLFCFFVCFFFFLLLNLFHSKLSSQSNSQTQQSPPLSSLPSFLSLTIFFSSFSF